MKRHILLASLIVFLTSVPAVAADGEGRFSGRVVDVKANALVLEVMGPWTGPGTGLSQRTFPLTSGVTVRQITPTGKWDDANPGYDIKTLDAKDLKPGDFVTVLTRTDRGLALDVVQPSDAGVASPPTEPTK